MLDVKQCYIDANALLKGHFLLSSGNSTQITIYNPLVCLKIQKSPKN